MTQNEKDGYNFYKNEPGASRWWFEKQWKVWPERAHQDRTMNISFHYGAVIAYREIHGSDPECSPEWQMHVDYLDGKRGG